MSRHEDALMREQLEAHLDCLIAAHGFVMEYTSLMRIIEQALREGGGA